MRLLNQLLTDQKNGSVPWLTSLDQADSSDGHQGMLCVQFESTDDQHTLWRITQQINYLHLDGLPVVIHSGTTLPSDQYKVSNLIDCSNLDIDAFISEMVEIELSTLKGTTPECAILVPAALNDASLDLIYNALPGEYYSEIVKTLHQSKAELAWISSERALLQQSLDASKAEYKKELDWTYQELEQIKNHYAHVYEQQPEALKKIAGLLRKLRRS